MFEQLGLIGCGLMGGSFALAMKKAGLVKRVVGYSKSPSTTDRAPRRGNNAPAWAKAEATTQRWFGVWKPPATRPGTARSTN